MQAARALSWGMTVDILPVTWRKAEHACLYHICLFVLS